MHPKSFVSNFWGAVHLSICCAFLFVGAAIIIKFAYLSL